MNYQQEERKLKKTIDLYEFRKEFEDYDRADNFSYAALDALYDYFEELEDDTGEQIELDVIGICCDYTEYASLQEFREEQGYDEEDYPDMDSLRDCTEVIEFDGGFIVQDF